MRAFLAALPLVALLAQSTPSPSPVHTLMPVPSTVRWSSGRVPIGPYTYVLLIGDDARMRAAALRLIGRIEGRTGFTIQHELHAA